MIDKPSSGVGCGTKTKTKSKMGIKKLLDETDLKILEALWTNGKISTVELGKRVKLTQPTVHYRIKKLESVGIIKDRRIIIDEQALGLLYAVTQITVEHGAVRDVVSALEKIPEVVDISLTLGAHDIIVGVVTLSPEELYELLNEKIMKIPHIRNVQFDIVIERKRAALYVTPEIMEKVLRVG